MGSKILIIGTVVLAAGILLFASVYNSNKDSSPRPTSSSVQGANIGDITPTQNRNQNPAPDFTLERLGGGTITLSQFQGEKPVILYFFATWCPNCKRHMPKLNKWYEDKYKDQVEIIGVNLQEDEGKVRDFIDSRSISFPIALDPRGQVSQKFGIRYTNTHILIDKGGSIVREIPGDIRESDIKSLIQ